MVRVARPTIQWYKSAVNTTTVTFTDGNGDPYDLSGFDSFKVVHYASYSSTAVQELTFSRVDNVFTVEPDSAELAEFKKGVNVLEFQFISNSKDLPNVYTSVNIELATAFAGSTNNISATTAISANEVTVEVTEAKAISTITLQSTDGLEKTYRITFTDGTTFDYVVTDGESGVVESETEPTDTDIIWLDPTDNTPIINDGLWASESDIPSGSYVTLFKADGTPIKVPSSLIQKSEEFSTDSGAENDLLQRNSSGVYVSKAPNLVLQDKSVFKKSLPFAMVDGSNVLAWDSFNRPNSNNLGTSDSGHIYNDVLGTGDWRIVENSARAFTSNFQIQEIPQILNRRNLKISLKSIMQITTEGGYIGYGLLKGNDFVYAGVDQFQVRVYSYINSSLVLEYSDPWQNANSLNGATTSINSHIYHDENSNTLIINIEKEYDSNSPHRVDLSSLASNFNGDCTSGLASTQFGDIESYISFQN